MRHKLLAILGMSFIMAFLLPQTVMATEATYDDVKTCDIERFKRYFLHMLKHGINLPQSQYEAVFLSSEHTEEHINKFLDAFRKFEG
jgi:glutamate-1-semialdehyde 2,1-aminomutase